MQVDFFAAQGRNLALLLELLRGRTRQHSQTKGHEARGHSQWAHKESGRWIPGSHEAGIGVWVKFSQISEGLG